MRGDAHLLRDYAERFWADYSPYWKPLTRKCNESAIFKKLIGAFGDQRIDDLAKGDILFWRDSFVERPGLFNRTSPIFSVMMGYADASACDRVVPIPARERRATSQTYGAVSVATRVCAANHPFARL